MTCQPSRVTTTKARTFTPRIRGYSTPECERESPLCGRQVSSGSSARSAPEEPTRVLANREVCDESSPAQRRLSSQALTEALVQLGHWIREVERNGTAPPSRRKLTLSPTRRGALKLQGQYMGHMLKPKQKAQVRALRAEDGITAAIGVARRLGQTSSSRGA